MTFDLCTYHALVGIFELEGIGMKSCVLCAVLCGLLSACGGDEFPPGHLLPLGSHMEPELVARLQATPTSQEFYSNYVQPNRPVLLEGLLNSTGLLENWGSDEYLREHFGGEEVSVEHGKKENRSETAFITNMADFLDRYESEDVYMVTVLPEAMKKEWLLPKFMLCGGFTENFMYSYTWFSSGGTRSVLHTDSYENLHCLVSGVKEFVLIDPLYISTVGPEHKNQGFYNIDVDRVDMLSHPGLASVPWYKVVVWPGDCLYLPNLWIHHVRSHGRNLGVNVWWIQFLYDSAGCSGAAEPPDFAPLADYDIFPELQLKQGLLEHVEEDGSVHATVIHQALMTRQQTYTGLELEVVEKIFEILKPGCQGRLLASEIHSLPRERYKSAFEYFWSTDPTFNSARQGEPEGEGEWWADEGGEWEGGGWEDGEGGSEWGYSEHHGDDVGEWDEEEGGGQLPHDHKPHDEL